MIASSALLPLTLEAYSCRILLKHLGNVSLELSHHIHDDNLLDVYCLHKVPELVDTVFIVLRKRPLIFLHWYHHVTVLLFCWSSFATESGSGNCISWTVTSSVHLPLTRRIFLIHHGNVSWELSHHLYNYYVLTRHIYWWFRIIFRCYELYGTCNHVWILLPTSIEDGTKVFPCSNHHHWSDHTDVRWNRGMYLLLVL